MIDNGVTKLKEEKQSEGDLDEGDEQRGGIWHQRGARNPSGVAQKASSTSALLLHRI